MVLLQADAPVRHGNRVHLCFHLTREVDLTTILKTAKDVHPCIGRVLQHVQHTAVCQATPYQLAIPRPAVGSSGKSQCGFRKLLHHGEGATCLAKKAKHQRYGSPHFLIRVQNGPALPVIAEPNRKGKMQFAFLCFIELATKEAPAQQMKFGLSHCPL